MKFSLTTLNMSEQPIRVKSVNAHQSNKCISSFLQGDTHFDILLIQEPWMGSIATLRSDTDPKGEPQQGLPFNDMWETHIPQHKPDEQCKAIAYTRKVLHCTHAIRNNLTHPLSNPNSVMIDILEGDDILIRLINIYNPPTPLNPLTPPHHPPITIEQPLNTSLIMI
jgi:hypothetical protein